MFIRATIGDLYDRCVQHYAARVAVTCGGRSMTYAQLGESAETLRTTLGALGVRPKERIAFLMANCAEYVFCEYAVAKSGATRVPLAVLLAPDDHVYMMNFAGCTTLIYHARFTERVLAMQPKLTTVTRLICVGGPPPAGHLGLDDLMAQGAGRQAPPAPPVDPEDIAGIYFTGGTTGRPKGVMLSHRSWAYTYWMESFDFDIGWNETFVFTTPLTHAGGCLILPVLLRGGRCVVVDHFEPDLLLDTIARERATSTLLVPTMIYALLDHPRLGDYDLGSLRNVLYGASVIAPERLEQAIQRFGPIFTQFYGQTEAPMALTALPRHTHVEATGERRLAILSSAGRATYGTEIRLLDDDGREVPAGECGEVVARAANMMSGYLDNPEATAEAIRDGWLHTGDIGRMDEAGFISIVDRKKDMIISGGFNIYPREIEDVLFEHPAVKQAAVVGVPSDKWGEEVRAVVVLHEGKSASADELISFVKERKGSLVAPKSVVFWPAIPLTNLGKVDKKAIRTRCWEGRDRKI
ncbi:MAG: AMP-binding protein [Rhodospirillales bacterium]|nr:AMP-binding protein [Rhodospirillales bacterium]